MYAKSLHKRRIGAMNMPATTIGEQESDGINEPEWSVFYFKGMKVSGAYMPNLK